MASKPASLHGPIMTVGLVVLVAVALLCLTLYLEHRVERTVRREYEDDPSDRRWP
jgi:hypothetical protein